MSQSCIIYLRLNWIFFKMSLNREHASSVLKLFYQTQSPVMLIKFCQKIPLKKQPIKQQILWIVKVSEKRGPVPWLLLGILLINLTLLLKNKRTSIYPLSLNVLCFINIAQFVNYLRMFVKFAELKFISFILSALIFLKSCL